MRKGGKGRAGDFFDLGPEEPKRSTPAATPSAPSAQDAPREPPAPPRKPAPPGVQVRIGRGDDEVGFASGMTTRPIAMPKGLCNDFADFADLSPISAAKQSAAPCGPPKPAGAKPADAASPAAASHGRAPASAARTTPSGGGDLADFADFAHEPATTGAAPGGGELADFADFASATAGKEGAKQDLADFADFAHEEPAPAAPPARKAPAKSPAQEKPRSEPPPLMFNPEDSAIKGLALPQPKPKPAAALPADGPRPKAGTGARERSPGKGTAPKGQGFFEKASAERPQAAEKKPTLLEPKKPQGGAPSERSPTKGSAPFAFKIDGPAAVSGRPEASAPRLDRSPAKGTAPAAFKLDGPAVAPAASAPKLDRSPAKGTAPGEFKLGGSTPEPPAAGPGSAERSPPPRSGATPFSSAKELAGGQNAAALQKYQRYLERIKETPEDADLLARLASICSDLGKKDEALNYFKRASRLQPDNGFVRQRLLELAGPDALKQLDSDTGRGDFSAVLRDFLRYPLRGNGLAVIIIGGIFFGILRVFVQGIAGITVGLVIGGYLFAYQFKVIRVSARGQKDPPDWPDIMEAAGESARMLGCYVAAYGVSFALALCGYFMTVGSPRYEHDMGTAREAAVAKVQFSAEVQEEMRAWEQRKIAEGTDPIEARDLAEQEFRERYPPPAPAVSLPSLTDFGHVPPAAVFFYLLALVAAFAGLVYFPMALLITTIFNSSRVAFNYAFGMVAIQRIGHEYFVCAGAYLASALLIGIVSGITSSIFSTLPVLGTLARLVILTAFGLYQLLALSYLVGRLYYHYEKEIGWFER